MGSLTAKELNEQIVRMRKVVEKARVRVSRRLIRQLKVLKKSENEKKKRKVARLEEETKACKKVLRDDVTKFALVNTKSRKDLKITGQMTPDERVLYKLSTDGKLLAAVDEFRKKYPDWRHEVPFLLQRLGLQYRSKKKRSSGAIVPPAATDENKDEKIKKADVSGLVKKQIVKAVRKEEAIAKKAIKEKEKIEKMTPPVIILPKPELDAPVVKGQAVIMRLNMDAVGANQKPEASSSNVFDAKSIVNENRRKDDADLSSDGDDVGISFFKKLRDLNSPSSSSDELNDEDENSEEFEGSSQGNEKDDVGSPVDSDSGSEEGISFFKKVANADEVKAAIESNTLGNSSANGIAIKRQKNRKGSFQDLSQRNNGKLEKKEKTVRNHKDSEMLNAKIRQRVPSKNSSNSNKRKRKEENSAAADGGTTSVSFEEKGLHPSWLAKKREREMLQKLKTGTQAKRIVFDDD